MADATINQQELKKLLKRLKTLPQKLNKSVINLGVKAGAKTIQSAARENIPGNLDDGAHSEGKIHDAQDLKDSISIKKRSKRSTKTGTIAYKIGIRLDGTGWFAHLIEWGSKFHAANPFMRPAYENNNKEALNAMTSYIKKRFAKLVKKGVV